MRTFVREKCKIATFEHTIFTEHVFIHSNCSYLYDNVNWKNNSSFKLLRTVKGYAILKIGIFVCLFMVRVFMSTSLLIVVWIIPPLIVCPLLVLTWPWDTPFDLI